MYRKPISYFIIKILYMQPRFSKKEKVILLALADVVVRKREEMGKSQRIFAYENDIQKSLLSRLENGMNEPKLFSLWKIANACDMKLSELIKLVEEYLDEDVILIDK